MLFRTDLLGTHWHVVRISRIDGDQAIQAGADDMIVSQLMSRNIVTCKKEDSLQEAAKKMWDHDIGCLPVLDAEERVIGIVTDRDVCMAAYTQGKELGLIPVASAMAQRVFSCSSTDSVKSVEAIMKEHQVRRVPIVDEEGRLQGLISMNDVARESAREIHNRKADISARELVASLASICEPRSNGSLTLVAQ
jgi:CBS domain-containing protein